MCNIVKFCCTVKIFIYNTTQESTTCTLSPQHHITLLIFFFFPSEHDTGLHKRFCRNEHTHKHVCRMLQVRLFVSLLTES